MNLGTLLAISAFCNTHLPHPIPDPNAGWRPPHPRSQRQRRKRARSARSHSRLQRGRSR